MAMPLFNPPAGFDPEEMLRRLGRIGAPPGELDDGLPLAWQSAAAGDKKIAAGLAPVPADAASKLPPQLQIQSGPGSFGTMLGDAAAFMGSRQPNEPSFAPPAAQAASPFSPTTAPQLPAFSPAALPGKPSFAPVQVDGAIRTGMFNPAGSNPWDRSLTANSPEEELRFRQDAAYNRVLDLIRPGGIGMPGTTGPIVGLQPHEIAALDRLGGRMAGDATQGRQIASQEGISEGDRQLRAMMGNQQTQTARDVANLEMQGKTALGNLDAQTRRDVAQIEAGSRNNPEAMRQQAVAQMAAAAIAGGADAETVSSHIANFKRAMADSGAARSGPLGTPPVAGRTPPQAEMNDDEVNATRILNQATGMIGQGKVGPEFKYKEGFGVQDADKVLDFLASQRAGGKLSPGAEASFWRQAQRLPNFNQFRDNLVRSGAGANYQIQPPMDPRTGKSVDLKYTGFAPPYAVSDDQGELYRYQHNPDMTMFRAGVGALTGEIPYSQVALPNGAGVVDINNSLMSPAGWSKKLPPEVLQARKAELDAMIRRLYPAAKK